MPRLPNSCPQEVGGRRMRQTLVMRTRPRHALLTPPILSQALVIILYHLEQMPDTKSSREEFNLPQGLGGYSSPSVDGKPHWLQ